MSVKYIFIHINFYLEFGNNGFLRVEGQQQAEQTKMLSM